MLAWYPRTHTFHVWWNFLTKLNFSRHFHGNGSIIEWQTTVPSNYSNASSPFLSLFVILFMLSFEVFVGSVVCSLNNSRLPNFSERSCRGLDKSAKAVVYSLSAFIISVKTAWTLASCEQSSSIVADLSFQYFQARFFQVNKDNTDQCSTSL